MSGFVGIWQRDGRPVDPAQLAALTESLRFRGPDGFATWHRGAVGLGHTRFTTHAGRDSEPQPLGLEGRFFIVGHIRLDAREELIARLCHSERSEESRSCSDAALVLRAWRAWGADCGSRIHGDFSFAIWDEPAQRLFCARDPFGVRPFFYAQFQDLLLVSNTLDCLRRHPRVSGRLGELALADYLCCGRLLEQHMSFFADIRRLPPGHTLTASSEGLRTAPCWGLPVEPYLRYREPRQYVEHFNDVFSRAVADRAGSGAVSIFLSGGLDSAAIAAAVAGKLGAPPAHGPAGAFTVGWNCAFRDPEPEHARMTAGALGLPIEVLEEPDHEPFKKTSAGEGPEVDDNFYRASFVRTLHRMSENSRVALNGQGGDEVFYRELLVDEARRHPGWRLAIDALRTWFITGKRPPIGLRTAPRVATSMPLEDSRAPDWIDPAWARKLDIAERLRALAVPLPAARQIPHAAARMRLRAPFWMPYVERYDAGFSGQPLETRWPFLDTRVIRFALRLPPFPWSVDKHLVRQTLAPLLPGQVASRPKTSLQGEPFSAYARTAPAWPDHVIGDLRALAQYVEPSRWREACERLSTLPEFAWSLGRPVSLARWLQSNQSRAVEARAGNASPAPALTASV